MPSRIFYVNNFQFLYHMDKLYPNSKRLKDLEFSSLELNPNSIFSFIFKDVICIYKFNNRFEI